MSTGILTVEYHYARALQSVQEVQRQLQDGKISNKEASSQLKEIISYNKKLLHTPFTRVFEQIGEEE